MESSAEHVRQEATEPTPMSAAPVERLESELVSDEYAQAELESRRRRIEMSIEKALRTT